MSRPGSSGIDVACFRRLNRGDRDRYNLSELSSHWINGPMCYRSADFRSYRTHRQATACAQPWRRLRIGLADFMSKIFDE
ncbi:MAG: hypothetical protein MI923_22335 [Phycisphaerales bacterium]|nr:hypothetical protein [Phycisphaerales bacterium]